MSAGIRPLSSSVLGLIFLGFLAGPETVWGGPVFLSAERFIRNPMGASSSETVPLKSATGFEHFDDSIVVAQEFDGNFDPQTGRDSTITSVTRIGQNSDFVGGAMLVIGFAEAYYNNTNSQGPSEAPNHEVESVFDVTFQLDRPHDFEFLVRSETTGTGEFRLTLDGPAGEVVAFEGTVMEDDSPVTRRGTVPAGLYHLRQTGEAATPNVAATADWLFQVQFTEQPLAVPLTPAALPTLAAAGALVTGSRLRRCRLPRG